MNLYDCAILSTVRPKVPDIDLIFALSSTSNKSDETLPQMRDIMKATVNTYGSSNIRYGIITFGDTVRKELDLNRTFLNEDTLKGFIDLIPKATGRPALVDALQEAESMFMAAASDRPAAKKVLVVLTDRKSINSEDELKNKSLTFIKMKVRIIALSIGGEANSTELEIITASSRDVIAVMKGDDPQKICENVMDRIQDGKDFKTLVLASENGF